MKWIKGKLTKSVWELAFQPGSSGTANLGPVLMQEADVLPLSLNSCPRKCKWDPKSGVYVHLLGFLLWLLLFQIKLWVLRWKCSVKHHRVWVEGVEGAAGAWRPSWDHAPSFPSAGLLALTQHRTQEKGRQRDIPTKTQPLLSSRSEKQTTLEAVCKGQFGKQQNV